ncbi:Peptidase family S58 [Botrimarina colliarenosi]|uniref:Peptidase family S58 n=1 Tax=Botrimarina colliarenosi TaxID=2528001 RepID=A0A5C6A6W2_9BACT|nr:P1 family peptidase [Botrimarina colliarenosi]TWT95176.1 Peptidase family S58 [Botrimarina colliarenosi]
MRKGEAALNYAGKDPPLPARESVMFDAKPLCRLAIVATAMGAGVTQAERPRLRDLGVSVGIFAPGRLNAITDVGGVRVGHDTLIEGDRVRTGATAILPHGGDLFQQKVPAAIVVGNGFGKLVGSTQVEELGQLETPILLTNTLNVWEAAATLVEATLAAPGNADVRSVNPVVGETNDGYLNDIRSRPLRPEHFRAALRAASPGPVAEGAIGAGTGVRTMGFKGGIGSSSRRLPGSLGGYTVGVLTQTNFSGLLTIAGAPVWRDLGPAPYPEHDLSSKDGSCLIVVATDAPLDARQLKRLARRALIGMGRTGADFSNGSGDYVIAFSANDAVRIDADTPVATIPRLAEVGLTPLFEAVAEATEEAIINALLRATTVRGRDGNISEAIPIGPLKESLRRYGVTADDLP